MNKLGTLETDRTASVDVREVAGLWKLLSNSDAYPLLKEDGLFDRVMQNLAAFYVDFIGRKTDTAAIKKLKKINK